MSELRRKILAASVELVAERGVRGVSFREVARRAGVSHQAPYHHFGNYQGILEAIGREGFDRLATAMNDAADAAGPDGLRALSAAGVAYVRFARDHLGHFRVMFQRELVDIYAEGGPKEEAERTQGTLTRLCTHAQADGYGLSLSLDDLTMLCLSTVHGCATLLVEGVLQAEFPTEAETTGIAQRAVGALSRLLGAKAGAPR